MILSLYLYITRGYNFDRRKNTFIYKNRFIFRRKGKWADTVISTTPSPTNPTTPYPNSTPPPPLSETTTTEPIISSCYVEWPAVFIDNQWKVGDPSLRGCFEEQYARENFSLGNWVALTSNESCENCKATLTKQISQNCPGGLFDCSNWTQLVEDENLGVPNWNPENDCCVCMYAWIGQYAYSDGGIVPFDGWYYTLDFDQSPAFGFCAKKSELILDQWMTTVPENSIPGNLPELATTWINNVNANPCKNLAVIFKESTGDNIWSGICSDTDDCSLGFFSNSGIIPDTPSLPGTFEVPNLPDPLCE